jgi:GNAT superfamily N-acetyltransferase
MEARKISENEIQAWLACPKNESDKNYAEWIKDEQDWVNDNDIKINNMFVVEENGKFLMKLCILDEDTEHILFLSPVIGNFPDKVQIAEKMFEFVIRETEIRNIQRVDAVIDDNNKDFDTFVSALQTLSFKINKRKYVYQRDLTEEVFIKSLPDAFSTKTIEDAGEDVFKQLFIDCVKNSFDTIEDFLPQTAESLYDEFCSDEETNTDLWKVFFKEGTPAAFILPAIISDSLGTFKYIGVLPEYRSKGLGTIFFQKGLGILKLKSAKYYIGSTACSNKPMIKVFENNKCSRIMSRVELVYEFV